MDSMEPTEKQSDQTGSSAAAAATFIGNLPRDLSFLALSKLPLTSLLECKLVNKNWYKSIKNDQQLAAMHLSRASEQDLCLVIFSDWPKSKLHLLQLSTTIRPLPSAAGGDMGISIPVKTLKLPFESVFPEFEIVGSCNGLLCLNKYYYDDAIYLFNPFMSQFRELPKLILPNPDLQVARSVFGFGSNPRTREYKVVRVVFFKQTKTDFLGGSPEAFVLGSGDSQWRKLLPNVLPDHLLPAGPTSEALVNGNLHYLSLCNESNGVHYRDIISFDLQTEQFHLLPRPSCGSLDRIDYHLMELHGCLAAVVPAGDGGHGIFVMEQYGVRASWVKKFVMKRYVPEERVSMMPPSRIRRNGCLGRGFRVLCGLESGEIVCLSSGRWVVLFDPKSGGFKDAKLVGEGLPLEFQGFVHWASMVSVDALDLG